MKKLPKAIRITGDNAGASEALLIPAVSVTAPSDQPLGKSNQAGGPALAKGLVQPAAYERPQTPTPEAAGAAGSLEAPMPPTEANSAQAQVRVRSNETYRHWRARAIVERHANYSAVGGVIPIPIINIAGVTAIILRMVRSLSNLYGVPFERNRARDRHRPDRRLNARDALDDDGVFAPLHCARKQSSRPSGLLGNGVHVHAPHRLDLH